MDNSTQITNNIEKEQPIKTVTNNNVKKSFKIDITNIIDNYFFVDVFIFFIIFLVFFYMVTPNYPKARSSLFKKSCFNELRFLSGAIEMYNMDNKQQMTVLNDENIKILIEKQYLKEYPRSVTPKCKYVSAGDLASDSGVIYCEAHGDCDGNIAPKYSESEVYKDIYAMQRRYRLKGNLFILFTSFISSFIFVFISKLLFPKLLTFFISIVGLFTLFALLLLAWAILSNFIQYPFQ